jgi:hypothetical protein
MCNLLKITSKHHILASKNQCIPTSDALRPTSCERYPQLDASSEKICMRRRSANAKGAPVDLRVLAIDAR